MKSYFQLFYKMMLHIHCKLRGRVLKQKIVQENFDVKRILRSPGGSTKKVKYVENIEGGDLKPRKMSSFFSPCIMKIAYENPEYLLC